MTVSAASLFADDPDAALALEPEELAWFVLEDIAREVGTGSGERLAHAGNYPTSPAWVRPRICPRFLGFLNCHRVPRPRLPW